jgi:hypothetical protein
MRERFTGASVAALAIAIVVTTAPAAAAAKRVSGSFSYTSARPGSVTGIVADFHYRNPDDPNAKPPAVAKLVVRTPPGSGIDVTARPQCHASDAELHVRGPDACPSSAKVGTALSIAESGRLGGHPMRATNDVIMFNSEDGIIGAAVNRDFPFIKNFDRTRVAGNTSTTVFPAFPGLPPPDNYTAFISMHSELLPLVGPGGRPWARTPPSCPRARYWTITATFTFHDGVIESIASRSPCTAKKRHKRKRPRGGPRVATEQLLHHPY